MWKIRETVRRDGLRVITVELPYASRVVFRVSSLHGGAHDPDKYLGLAHLIEHLVFQGTRKRTWRQIQIGLDNVCLERKHNAETTHLYTSFFGTTIQSNFYRLAEILLDIYCNPIFPDERIANEKAVIGAELLSVSDPKEVASLELIDLLYPKDGTISRGIIGNRRTISLITREILVEEHYRSYNPANSIVIAAGNITHEKTVEAVNGSFPLGAPRKSTIPGRWDGRSQYSFGLKSITRIKKGMETAIICLGVKVPCRADLKTNLILKMLRHFFGGMLYEEIRQIRGLVYDVNDKESSQEPIFRSFYLRAEVEISKMKKVTGLMRKIAIRDHLPHELFEEIRARVRDECSVGFETTEGWNEFILNEVMNGKDGQQIDKDLQSIGGVLDEISFDEVVRKRQEMMTRDRLFLSIVTGK